MSKIKNVNKLKKIYFKNKKKTQDKIISLWVLKNSKIY